jgi:hypothetical protein
MLLTLKKPVLSPLLAKELKDLAKDGITPDPAEVLWLAKLCEEAVRPNRRVASQIYGLPVRCGNVLLYRPCYGARLWFDEVCRKYLSEFSPHVAILIHGFMCANGRNVEIFDNIITKADILKHVKAWAKTVNATIPELEDGIDLALDIEPPGEKKQIEDGMREPKPNDNFDFGELAAFLCHYYDVSYDEIRRLPDATVEAMIDALPAIMQSENPIPGGTSTAQDDRALWNLRQGVRIIRRDHEEMKAKQANG